MEGFHKLILVVTFVMAQNNVKQTNAECPNCDTIYLTVEKSNGEVDIKWTFNDTGTNVYGFRTIFYDADGTEVYESPILHLSERYMKIHKELDGKTSVCVQIIGNETTVLYEECQTVKVTDLKAVIGILAGGIFLIPCVIGLIYIIVKDKQITKAMDYEKLEQNSLPDTDVHIPKVNHGKAKVNHAFIAEIIVDEKEVNNAKTKATVESDTDNVSENTEPSTLSETEVIDSDNEIQEMKNGQLEIQMTELHTTKPDRETDNVTIVTVNAGGTDKSDSDNLISSKVENDKLHKADNDKLTVDKTAHDNLSEKRVIENSDLNSANSVTRRESIDIEGSTDSSISMTSVPDNELSVKL